ncbi:MAG: exosortase A [Burkholderiales bacterium]
MAAMAIVIVLAVVYRDTLASMVDLWYRSSSYQHGFAVIPIVIWLIWSRRNDLARVPVEPSLLGLVAMAAAGFIWLLGALAHASVVVHFALVSMIVAAVPAIAGLQVARALVFPLGCLFFAVPFGDFMVPTLMDWTADFVVTALRATGVPVFREGNDFVIPSGRWSVVEACSGIRYFHAALMGGALFSYLIYRGTARRMAFIAASIVVPIIANWLRAYLIVLLGHLSNNRLASGVDHLVYGWVFFGIVMFVIFWVGTRWREDRQGDDVKVPIGQDRPHTISGSKLGLFASAALLIGIVWMPFSQSIQARLDAFVPAFSDKGIRAVDWRVVDAVDSSWRPVLPGARMESRTALMRGNERAGVHIAWFYGEQDGAKSKLVSSQNVLADQQRNWRTIDRGAATIPWGGGTRSVRRDLLANDVEQIAVYSFYWIAGFSTSSDLLASAMLAVSRLVLFRNDAAMVLIYAHVGPTGASPLGGFATDASASIDEALVTAGQRLSATNYPQTINADDAQRR